MSKTMSIATAIRKAESNYEEIEKFHSRSEVLAEVRRLADVGVTSAAIAGIVGMSERNVERIRNNKVQEPKPPVRYRFDRRQDRFDKLEKMAGSAFDLACKLRDEDPQLVWEALSMVDRQQLQELTVILLAGLPIDRSASEIFGWCS